LGYIVPRKSKKKPYLPVRNYQREAK